MTYSVASFQMVTNRIAFYSELDVASDRDMVQLASWIEARNELIGTAHTSALTENI